jgi:large subunit ribosomal protein L15
MKLHELAPAPGSKRERRRVGRGHGSGRVKTAGKGTKGANARSGTSGRPFFEGGQNPWTMRIPHRRGFSNRRFKVVSQVVNLAALDAAFAEDDTVTLAALGERGLVGDASGKRPVKVLGDGSLTKRLTIEVHAASAGARRAIESAGGSLRLIGAPADAGTEAAGGAGAEPAQAAETAPVAEAAPAAES